MPHYIPATFLIMGMVFYEISGGSNFDPVEAGQAALEKRLAHKEIVMTALTSEGPVLAPAFEPADVPVAPVRVAKPEVDLPHLTRASLDKPLVADVIPAIAKKTVQPVGIVQKPTNVAPAPQTAAAEPLADHRDIRAVTATGVNVRKGPGKTHAVINRVTRGDLVEIVKDNGSGWVEMRVLGREKTGWVADFLLSKG